VKKTVDNTNLLVYYDVKLREGVEMMLQITLEAARRNAGYTIEEAALLFEIHHQTLSSYERDSSKVPFDFVEKIPNVYGIPKTSIFFGNRYDFIRTLRERTLI